MTLAGSLTVFFRLPSLVTPFFGVISDRVDLRQIAIWAPAFTAVTMSLLGVAPDYFTVCFLLVCAGTSAAIFHVLGPVMIAQVGSGNLGKGMGIWMTGGEMARTVGPLIAVWAVSMWGFEGSYPIMGLGIIASMLLYLNLKDMSLVPGKKTQDKSGGIWHTLHRVMIPLTGVMISRASLAATLTAFLPTYMVVTGRSLWVGGMSLAVLEFSGIVGTLFGGTLSDKVGQPGCSPGRPALLGPPVACLCPCPPLASVPYLIMSWVWHFCPYARKPGYCPRPLRKSSGRSHRCFYDHTFHEHGCDHHFCGLVGRSNGSEIGLFDQRSSRIGRDSHNLFLTQNPDCD